MTLTDGQKRKLDHVRSACQAVELVADHSHDKWLLRGLQHGAVLIFSRASSLDHACTQFCQAYYRALAAGIIKGK